MPPRIIAGFTIDRHRGLGKDRRAVEKRAVVLAAIEAMTKTDAVRAPRGHDPDVAAQASAGEPVHVASPSKTAVGPLGALPNLR